MHLLVIGVVKRIGGAPLYILSQGCLGMQKIVSVKVYLLSLISLLHLFGPSFAHPANHLLPLCGISVIYPYQSICFYVGGVA